MALPNPQPQSSAPPKPVHPIRFMHALESNFDRLAATKDAKGQPYGESVADDAIAAATRILLFADKRRGCMDKLRAGEPLQFWSKHLSRICRKPERTMRRLRACLRDAGITTESVRRGAPVAIWFNFDAMCQAATVGERAATVERPAPERPQAPQERPHRPTFRPTAVPEYFNPSGERAQRAPNEGENERHTESRPETEQIGDGAPSDVAADPLSPAELTELGEVATAFCEHPNVRPGARPFISPAAVLAARNALRYLRDGMPPAALVRAIRATLDASTQGRLWSFAYVSGEIDGAHSRWRVRAANRRPVDPTPEVPADDRTPEQYAADRQAELDAVRAELRAEKAGPGDTELRREIDAMFAGNDDHSRPVKA